MSRIQLLAIVGWALLAAVALPVTAAWAGAPSWSQISASGWTHHGTRQHDDAGTVQVYKKTIGELPCFQGVATTDPSPDALLDVAADIEGTLQWSSAGVAEAVTLKRGGSTLDYYQYLDVPGWTLANDRFWFLHGTIERSGGKIVFRWERADVTGAYAQRYQQVKAAHPKAIEPPTNSGGWVFSPTDQGTQIQYYICSDTGGVIPTAVQNAATTRTLPDTVGDLVREARRRTQ